MSLSAPTTTRVAVIDSHTGGEPTRLVIEGGPDLGRGPLAGRLDRFRNEFDFFRSAVVNEPRGSDVIVGALLCEPADPSCTAGVIFFNNVGYLGMCGHGTIGLVVTLAHMGRIGPGVHSIETPVGVVTAELNEDGSVSIENVISYRSIHQLALSVPGYGTIHGDVAWGGNWFYLCEDHGLEVHLRNIERLTDLSWKIRGVLRREGIAGADGHEIDHVELCGPADPAVADSRNFVLCPGGAYDRSPCGTGTSARVACLASDGALAEGQRWRQESVVGSVFEACYRRLPDGALRPSITGRAWVNGESTLLLDASDPFCMGIRA